MAREYLVYYAPGMVEISRAPVDMSQSSLRIVPPPGAVYARFEIVEEESNIKITKDRRLFMGISFTEKLLRTFIGLPISVMWWPFTAWISALVLLVALVLALTVFVFKGFNAVSYYLQDPPGIVISAGWLIAPPLSLLYVIWFKKDAE